MCVLGSGPWFLFSPWGYLYLIYFLYKYTEIENIKSEVLQEKGGGLGKKPELERSAQANLTSSLTL